MKLSQRIVLSILVAECCALCGCHIPSDRAVFAEFPDSSHKKPGPATPSVSLVAHFTRPDAKREDIVQAILSDLGLRTRARQHGPSLTHAQKCADFILAGSEVIFPDLSQERADSLFWDLTAAGVLVNYSDERVEQIVEPDTGRVR
ncbi:MAG TPA: hypothetical protein VFE51_15435 [Verrucomicrobiae bacterium]|nr:hypothetical protein [Verrucomicrobiae bacterium]